MINIQIVTANDSHVYLNHIDKAQKQLTREPYKLPTLNIKKPLKSIEDIESLDGTDFEVVDYQSHSALLFPMAV